MMIYTIRDLIHWAADSFGERDYLRYSKDEQVKGITFNQFRDETDAIAAWTMQQNKELGRRIRIAMLSPNNALYAELMFGVMSGGGISVPMDPQITHEVLCNCINKAEVDIIIHDQAIKLDRKDIYHRCKTVKSIFYLQDEENKDCADIIEQFKGTEYIAEIQEKDCAVIMFTSGTTGVEKGVMLSHANLIDTTFNAEFKPYVQISVLPMHHAFGLKADFLAALGIGSTTCFHHGMDKLGEALHLFEPTNLNIVPMIANALYTKIVLLSQQTRTTLEECKGQVLGRNIQQIITGGAHLPAELVDKYQEIGVYIAQGYGMSECSPSISAPCMNRPDKAHSGGMLVKGCEVRIVEGEIQVKSPSVMMGYVNAPELTREILTEDGWLRTGDLGYVDDERFIYITGRKKNLIILSNGENVAPEQIENLLLDHQLVEECLVYGEGSQIVAEIYPNDKYAQLHHITDIIDAVEYIVKEVNGKLISYQKIMKHIVRKNPFIKTGTNKIVRSQRAKREDTLTVESDKVSRPVSELQGKLHNILSQIIGHKEFGVNTDLFSAGLDSLGCILTLTEFSEKLNFHMELDELMSNASIEKLEVLFLKKNTGQKMDYHPRAIYPLTNLQKYMIYVMRGNTTANIPFLYKVDEGIDLNRLKTAVENLFTIHPILKSTIEMNQDQGLALFRHDDLKVEIPIYTLSEEEWLEEKEELIKPYLYGKNEPLYHIGIYSVEGDKFLFIDIAHVISDGMSIGILLRNLNKLYQGEVVQKEEYTFYEYALDEQFRTENGLRASSEFYFQRLLEGMQIDRSILNRKGDLGIQRNAAIHASLPDLNLRRVGEFCRKNGVSKNVLFLTAFNYCISVFADKDDVISTSIHNGRIDSRWGSLVGALFTTYNFRYVLDKYQSIAEMLAGSAKQIMETMCCYVNSLLADEMFIQYQGELFRDLEIGGKPAVHIPLQLDSMPFHLMIHESANGFTYELRYWENRFQEKQLRVFMDVLEAVVRGMIRTDSVNNLRSYLPKKHLVEEWKILIDGLEHRVTIKNRYGDVQPVGGWGKLYIDDINTEKIARVLTDHTIDYLENSGRCVMQDTLTGRYFIHLGQLEKALYEYPGVNTSKVYICYGLNNKFVLTAEVTAEEGIKTDALKAYAIEKANVSHQPFRLVVNGQEVIG